MQESTGGVFILCPLKMFRVADRVARLEPFGCLAMQSTPPGQRQTIVNAVQDQGMAEQICLTIRPEQTLCEQITAVVVGLIEQGAQRCKLKALTEYGSGLSGLSVGWRQTF
jgi:hypothetical protein